MNNCPHPSFSLSQRKSPGKHAQETQPGAVSAGTVKIMIPDRALTLGLLQDLPASSSRGVCLWARKRLSDSSELSRALPQCRSCPYTSSCQHSQSKFTYECQWAAREGGRCRLDVLWYMRCEAWGPVCALRATGDRRECWRENFQKSHWNCSVVWSLDCCLDKYLPVRCDGNNQVKHCVWRNRESFPSTALSHGVSYIVCSVGLPSIWITFPALRDHVSSSGNTLPELNRKRSDNIHPQLCFFQMHRSVLNKSDQIQVCYFVNI